MVSSRAGGRRGGPGRLARRRTGPCLSQCWPDPGPQPAASALRRCRPWLPAAGGDRGFGCSHSWRPAWHARGPSRWWSRRRWSSGRRRSVARRPCAGQRALGELLELAGVAEVKARRNVPTVDGAMTRWPSTLAVGPAAQQVGVVDAVPPAKWHPTTVSSLAPGLAAPGRSPRSMSRSAAWRSPAVPPRSPGAAAQRWRPRAGRRRRPGGGQWLGGVMLASKRCPPRHAETVVRQPYSRSSEGPFHARISSPRIPHRWLERSVGERLSGRICCRWGRPRVQPVGRRAAVGPRSITDHRRARRCP